MIERVHIRLTEQTEQIIKEMCKHSAEKGSACIKNKSEDNT